MHCNHFVVACAGLQFGNVALLMAARKDFVGCMRLLINAGAEVHFVGPAGMTAWSGPDVECLERKHCWLGAVVACPRTGNKHAERGG
jgi:hypothetical protein